jgi:hypothetical protein
VAVFAAALQGCRSLTSLRVHGRNFLLQEHLGTLFNVLAALPFLQKLDLSDSTGATEGAQKTAAGRAIGALLAANPPSLDTLEVTNCELGDLGLRPLLDGLASNTHLRALYCRENNPSEAFMHEWLGPAQRVLAARDVVVVVTDPSSEDDDTPSD